MIDCIPYTSLDRRGRAERVQRNGVRKAAYVWAYEDEYGPLPAGTWVCHTCDNPACVNPEHLYAGDATTNNRDTVDRGRNRETRKTHCPQGHPYDDENTSIRSSRYKTSRRCKECHRSRERARWARKRETA